VRLFYVLRFHGAHLRGYLRRVIVAIVRFAAAKPRSARGKGFQWILVRGSATGERPAIAEWFAAMATS
jgi:hypothetical protein